MPPILSEPVVDVAAAVDKLRADDRLITSAHAQLCEVEAIADAITGLQAVLVRRLRAAWNTEATKEVAGRGT